MNEYDTPEKLAGAIVAIEVMLGRLLASHPRCDEILEAAEDQAKSMMLTAGAMRDARDATGHHMLSEMAKGALHFVSEVAAMSADLQKD